MVSCGEINRQEYDNPSNWHYTLYASRKDSRIVVPKKSGLRGYTVNFAKPLGIMIHVAIIVVVTVAVVAGYAAFFGS
ncbi:MAG: hypothetical protein JXA71_02190 [Chitinispirillaceae bacterium]|nr:hypothetical protein [Chitinispirillaceae bacterium]